MNTVAIDESTRTAIVKAWKTAANANEVAKACGVSWGTANKHKPGTVTTLTTRRAVEETEETTTTPPAGGTDDAGGGDGEDLAGDVLALRERLLELLELVADLSADNLRLRRAAGV